MKGLEEIEGMLRQYSSFQECVVTDFTWRHFGTTFDVTLDYRWRPDGTVRPDEGPLLLVTLSFARVQELRIRNALNASMLANPERLSWGLNEISLLVIESSTAWPSPPDFFRASFWRENGAWIEITFADLTWTERVVS